MTERIGRAPGEGPKIIRATDFVSTEGFNVDERIMRFQFTDAEDEGRRREIAEAVFNLLYAGDFRDEVLDWTDKGIGYLAFGQDITDEKPIKPEEEMTEDEREAYRLMGQYLVRSEFTPRRTIQTF